MSRKDKLVERLQRRPADFTFEEVKALLTIFGYELLASGKTGGSRMAFGKGSDYIRMHKPHPRNELKLYQVDDLLDAFKERGLL